MSMDSSVWNTPPLLYLTFNAKGGVSQGLPLRDKDSIVVGSPLCV